MSIIQAILLGIIEGITEFLPVSSTGHLTIVEKLMGLSIDDPAITAFTAVIEVGAIAAAIVYFRHDIIRIVTGWVRGIFSSGHRNDADYKFGWAVILGSVPIAIVGLLFKNQIETTLRSLWFVAIALIGWSIVLWLADRYGTGRRHESQTNWRDTLLIGLVQCIALIPGISRSGATISAGLFRGFDRVAATRLSFFLGIPALVAAGALEAVTRASDISNGVGWTSTIVALLVSFVVGYISIAWLLKYVARHNFSVFIVYRILLGVALVALLATGAINAT
jgi:undecaprenyl-diphosphatase